MRSNYSEQKNKKKVISCYFKMNIAEKIYISILSKGSISPKLEGLP